MFGRPEPNRHGQSTIPIIAGVDYRPHAKPPQTNEVANRVFSGFAPTAERKASATWRRENQDTQGDGHYTSQHQQAFRPHASSPAST
jgi:hypothetical protein